MTATFTLLNNQDGNYTYDAAGNVTYDPGTGNSYKFDRDGNVVEVDQSGSVVASYYYNALNQRVRTVVVACRIKWHTFDHYLAPNADLGVGSQGS